MPLITNKIKISNGHILIWRLEESVDELRSRLPDWLDLTEYHTISHPRKKREWLAGRLLFVALCSEAGIPFQGIWKSPEGKPFLLGSPAHISLTHSEHLVAAALHFHAPIGIDLERPRAQLLRVAPKYLSPPELKGTGRDIELLCKYWSSKEAVYKLFGGKKISFRENIRISPPEVSTSWTAIVTTPAISGRAVIQLERIQEYCLAIAFDGGAQNL